VAVEDFDLACESGPKGKQLANTVLEAAAALSSSNNGKFIFTFKNPFSITAFPEGLLQQPNQS
jgi:hypothetical protein